MFTVCDSLPPFIVYFGGGHTPPKETEGCTDQFRIWGRRFSDSIKACLEMTVGVNNVDF